MLLRSSIANTKKFFQRTLQGFKSFLKGDNYEKLPKSASPFPNSYPYAHVNHACPPTSTELDKFYSDFTGRWDSEKGDEAKSRSKNKEIVETTQGKVAREGTHPSMFSRSSPLSKDGGRTDKRGCHSELTSSSSQQDKRRTVSSSSSKSVRDARICLIAQKLKKLEMMDHTNIDHVLDIEEVFHYYSLLTCPAYLDIIDKFFTGMYTEFFAVPVLKAHGRGHNQ